jgi:pilus biogenesis lipoprotein CpaD
MAKAKHLIVTLALAPLLAACTSEWDMQGVDPKDYYKEHPMQNRVETKYESHTIHFPHEADRLAPADINDFRASLRSISPLAVDWVQVMVPSSQATYQMRKEHVTKLLHSMGYREQSIMFEPSEAVNRDEMQINIAYASVITPHCPDWRLSPVTSYSNTSQGNIGCSSISNLGKMVADPRDLERGEGAVSPDASRNALVIKNYRAGTDIGAAASAGGSTSSSGTSSSGTSSSTSSGQ